MFIQTGITVFNAIFQLFLISFAASILVRRNIVSAAQVKALSDITITILLPCLIVAKIVTRFHPGEFANWWILPLSGAFMVVTGLFFSGLLFRFKPEKRPLMTLASMQNAIYIVLPIGQILFADQFDLFALYCFLVVLGLNPVMWSIGKVMISGKKEARFQWKDFMTPPLAAILVSVSAVLTKLSLLIPDAVLSAVDLLGQGTVPLAVFILGATIGQISLKDLPPLPDILIVTGVKFVLLPSVVFALLLWGKVNSIMPLFGSLMVIQAASPPATNLILIAKSYGGDTRSFSSMMLIQYLVCILVMPLWIAAWQYIVS